MAVSGLWLAGVPVQLVVLRIWEAGWLPHSPAPLHSSISSPSLPPSTGPLAHAAAASTNAAAAPAPAAAEKDKFVELFYDKHISQLLATVVDASAVAETLADARAGAGAGPSANTGGLVVLLKQLESARLVWQADAVRCLPAHASLLP